MKFDRRTLLMSAPGLLAGPARAEEDFAPLKRYEQETGGRIGLHAVNLASGVQLAWRAHERFVMCSTFKASLAACVLVNVDRGREQLTDEIAYGAKDIKDYAPVAKQNLSRGRLSIAEACQAAVELSDNTCANLLLARIGGPSALTAFWRSNGDRISRLDHNEPLLNRTPPGGVQDTTTPAAMTENFRRFVFGDVLSPASRDRLCGWLVACKTGGDRLRAGLPSAWRIGDKTGNNGKDGFSDIAVAWRPEAGDVLISAYTRGGSPTRDQVAHVFAAIGPIIQLRL